MMHAPPLFSPNPPPDTSSPSLGHVASLCVRSQLPTPSLQSEDFEYPPPNQPLYYYSGETAPNHITQAEIGPLDSHGKLAMGETLTEWHSINGTPSVVKL
eukprot:sb/3478623/